MASALPFKTSERYTLGVELELQVLNSRDYDLVGAAGDLLALLDKVPHPGEIKPEITEAMIEVSTGIQHGYAGVLSELTAIRDAMVRQAQRLNLGVAGGGTHPFQQWQDQRIFSAPRYRYIHDLYGYLAKQFTVFGQHVHVSCDSGDAAVWLIHLFSRYIPHFIALSASSPFFQGADTAFASSRLNSVSAFPLAGHIPFLPDWAAGLFGPVGHLMARSLRLSNRKLRHATGWVPAYPSVREGWPSVVREMRMAAAGNRRRTSI